jgi:glutamate synthase (NADPH/NADH) large chain
VTTEYLVNADMIQIKVAQGAKPGEGGQLPGHKVDAVIAKVRHSTPGVGLISPPPHHDIYSIEDLAQLIFDLKNTNPAADISVKLVSEVGVGTVAAGVAKARADHITISGYEGGTGASPLTSIKHAGAPWELGLAETQQTLITNGLRSRIALQVDGGLRTGRDVIIGALLGADEFGFSTAPLIAAGCIMMRKCHLNTCPVGIATQDPVLRKRFKGAPEHVINFFFFVAEEVRAMMAELGIARFDDLIGRSDWLDKDAAIDHWKAKGLDFTRLFWKPDAASQKDIRWTQLQKHPIDDVLDRKLIELAQPALESKTPVQIDLPVKNVDRSVGAMLSGEVAKRYGHKGLPDDTIAIKLTGTAGQSFGAFVAKRRDDRSGRRRQRLCRQGPLRRPPGRAPAAKARSCPNARSSSATPRYMARLPGECYFQGVAGERFGVRNSGAVAVVEGCGDHGCEYMTGGVIVVLGETGRNFAAGMSGGIAYVLDEHKLFAARCNLAMVELEPVPEEDDLMEKLHHHGGDLESKGRVDLSSDMTRFDEERLFQLVTNHARYTGSARAKMILDEWDTYRPMFVKVMPVEYRRALEEMEAMQMQGVAAFKHMSKSMPGPRRISVWGDAKSPAFWKSTARIQSINRRATASGISRSSRSPCRRPTSKSRPPAAWTVASPIATGPPAARSTTRSPTGTTLSIPGDWEGAIRDLHSTNNFPEFTGRICPAPCEEACTLNLENTPVAIKTVEQAIADKAWKMAGLFRSRPKARPANRSPSSVQAPRAWQLPSSSPVSATMCMSMSASPMPAA